VGHTRKNILGGAVVALKASTAVATLFSVVPHHVLLLLKTVGTILAVSMRETEKKIITDVSASG